MRRNWSWWWSTGFLVLVVLTTVMAVGTVPVGTGVEGARPAVPSAATAASPVTPAPTPAVHVVAPSGSDAGPGTAAQPWGTLQHALETLQAGETLYVRAGTYVENVHVPAEQMHPGTATSPVKVLAYPGERPVVQGLLWLTNPSYWQLDGINVTWNPGNPSSSHMVKLLGGTGWRFGDAEVWGAHSYAALLVGSGAQSFRIDHTFIHDTYESNDANQDHLVYVDNGQDGSGVIEHNVLARSANGRGVKLGPGSLSDPGTSNIVIRYNTFDDNRGPSNIQLSGSSSNNQIYGNLLVGTSAGQPNITAWRLTGTSNLVRDNLGWSSTRVVDRGAPGYVDGGGNVHVDPRLTNPEADDFTARAETARSYGSTDTALAVVWSLLGP